MAAAPKRRLRETVQQRNARLAAEPRPAIAPDEKFLTNDEIAARTQTSKKHLERLQDEGHMRYVDFGLIDRERRVPLTEYERFLRDRTRGGPTA